MIDDDTPTQEFNQGLGLGTVFAIIGAFIIGALVTANTSSIDINFIVYKAHNIPLWWYTLIVVILAVITDRIIGFVMRRRKARRNKKRALAD
jgi:ABC-type branched-subunit amino acid transport system permease subunit